MLRQQRQVSWPVYITGTLVMGFLVVVTHLWIDHQTWPKSVKMLAGPATTALLMLVAIHLLKPAPKSY